MNNIEEQQEGTEAMLEAVARQWCADDMPSESEFLSEFNRRRINMDRTAGRPSRRTASAAAPAVDPARRAEVVSLTRRWYALAAALVVLLALAGGYRHFVGGANGASVVAFAAGETSGDSDESLQPGTRLTTGPDGRALLALDGTRILCYVNAGTDLEFVRHDRLSLRSGELWFEVTPNSGRFEVETPHGSVVVHGTTFGVAASGDSLEAALATGSVSMETADGSTVLEPGQIGATDTSGAVVVSAAPSDRLPPPWAVALRVEAGMVNASRYFPSAHPPAGNR